ncbi:hypothetical protein QR680_005049 [Steinernema hermaphroditum]|uniref:Globin domain-containing protein n=1 Tax=Steinernema hermaphroditum TaxID=289476 RepID=A0AA39HRR5_9BILA|nr:hypothetical protein QR680_005049 [Steinernema hermaphroditum]
MYTNSVPPPGGGVDDVESHTYNQIERTLIHFNFALWIFDFLVGRSRLPESKNLALTCSSGRRVLFRRPAFASASSASRLRPEGSRRATLSFAAVPHRLTVSPLMPSACSCFGFGNRRKSDSVGVAAIPKPASNQTAPADPSTSAVDPRIPLTERQKFLLVANWKGISRKATETGATMFVQLLQSNEQFYEVFNFSHVRMASKEEQMQDERITKHAETVMKMLDVVISNVKDADYMFQLLQKSGTEHAHRPRFSPEFFWKIEAPFLYAVKEILQDRYTENMDQIYRVIIKIVLSTLEESCRAELERMGVRNGS